MTIDPEPTIERLFAAIERGDAATIEDLYDDGVEVWHNVTGRTMGKADNLALLGFWSGAVENLRYEVLERRAFAGGVVQRHVVHGTAGGETLRAEVCIVIHVEDGRITRIFEYLDERHVAVVFRRP